MLGSGTDASSPAGASLESSAERPPHAAASVKTIATALDRRFKLRSSSD
jgi:hypothetical protein